MMNELLLQQVWKLQYFMRDQLMTECGKELVIHFPGVHNLDAGPDFLDARIKIAQTEWAGNVELHIRTSDWFKHQHQLDLRYSNVILHVVWIHDMDTFCQSPILTLAKRSIQIDKTMMQSILSMNQKIPCSTLFQKKHFTSNIQHRLLKLRLEKKCREIEICFQQSNYDWDQTLWVLLCRNMGHRVNEEAFEKLAYLLPYKIIQKYAQDSLTMDALLFGVSGLINKNYSDEYPNKLKIRFESLKLLHSLNSKGVDLLFLRMRPMNFPTIRLAQLSAIVCDHAHRMNELVEVNSVNDVKSFFHCRLNEYWTNHYLFDKPSVTNSKHMGDSLVNNLFINSVIPLKVTRLLKFNRQQALDMGIAMLKTAKPEENRIVHEFIKLGLTNESAAVSQALIELYNSFCAEKGCMNCMIEHEISKNY